MKWRPSAPKFVLESPFVNIPLMIQHKLLEFYLNSEYKENKWKQIQITECLNKLNVP